MQLKAAHKVVKSCRNFIIVADVAHFYPLVWQPKECLPMRNPNRSYRLKAYEGASIFSTMIVATLHEFALRKQVAKAEIGTYRCDKVAC